MERAFLAVCLPRSESLLIMPLVKHEHETLGIEPCMCLSATSVAPIKATRPTVLDLLVLKADGSLGLLTHGLSELPLTLVSPHAETAPIPSDILLLKDPLETSVTLCFNDKKTARISLSLAPTFHLTRQCLHMFAMVLPPEPSFQFHYLFLLRWSDKGFVNSSASFDALREATYDILGLGGEPKHQPAPSAWDALGQSRSFTRFADDPALRKLALPPAPCAEKITQVACAPHDMHINFLNGLHHVAQDLLLSINDHEDLKRLVPVICKLAVDIRPEWADYWKRLFPDAMGAWPAPSTASKCSLSLLSTFKNISIVSSHCTSRRSPCRLPSRHICHALWTDQQPPLGCTRYPHLPAYLSFRHSSVLRLRKCRPAQPHTPPQCDISQSCSGQG